MSKNRTPAKKAGRPPFKPTAPMRRKVSIAAAAGMSHEEISTALGIARNTLTKYFEAELSEVAIKRRLEVFEAMHRAALKGNVSAQRAFAATVPTFAVPPLAEDEPGAKPEKLGKKEQAERDAKTAAAGTDWDDLLTGNVVKMRA